MKKILLTMAMMATMLTAVAQGNTTIKGRPLHRVGQDPISNPVLEEAKTAPMPYDRHSAAKEIPVKAENDTPLSKTNTPGTISQTFVADRHTVTLRCELEGKWTVEAIGYDSIYVEGHPFWAHKLEIAGSTGELYFLDITNATVFLMRDFVYDSTSDRPFINSNTDLVIYVEGKNVLKGKHAAITSKETLSIIGGMDAKGNPTTPVRRLTYEPYGRGGLTGANVQLVDFNLTLTTHGKAITGTSALGRLWLKKMNAKVTAGYPAINGFPVVVTEDCGLTESQAKRGIVYDNGNKKLVIKREQDKYPHNCMSFQLSTKSSVAIPNPAYDQQ